MATKPSKSELRAAPRQSLSVPFRVVVPSRPGQIIDGETIDVSSRGMGMKFGRGKAAGLDALLESLVEDRLPIEVTLRFEEGSIRAEGQLVWWGMLGDDDKFALRGGFLLRDEWAGADWELIQKHLES